MKKALMDLTRSTALVLVFACSPFFAWSLSVIHSDLTIRFPENRSEVAPDDVQRLRRAACDAIQNQGPVTVEGYASRHEAQPDQLARRRADEVASVLMQAGVDRDHLKVTAFGARLPVASEDDPRGAAKNRRVDVSAGPVNSQKC